MGAAAPAKLLKVEVLDLGKIEAFLRRYEAFAGRESEACGGIGELLWRFQIELPRLKKEEEEWETLHAPHFNIFRALRIVRRETKLHSRFLAFLLDPRASHGQKHAFLKLFLGGLKETRTRLPGEPWETSDWRVTTEEPIKGGRLDLVLRCKPASGVAGFIAVVENKVDAWEGQEQLQRYANWLEGLRQEFEIRNLLFLSPEGRDPVTISPEKCVCLSYREHIADWLRRSLEVTTAVWLRSAIEQYLQVVQSF